jgi:4-hydroxybenzoate polyprenyltransferase
MTRRLTRILTLTKFQHTLLGLPFTLSAMLMAADGLPTAQVVGLILLAFMGARSLGMAWNRLVDRKIDARNPRTKHRLMARGVLTPLQVFPYLLIFALILTASAYALNDLTFKLLPLCFFLLLLYPYSKRFTSSAHCILGAVLGLAPIGAWIAVRGDFAWAPMALGCGVLLWVSGFDILYALQDAAFDREEGLYSVPAKLGESLSLKLALGFHLLAVLSWAACDFLQGYHWPFHGGLFLITSLLIAVHIWVRKDKEKHLGPAFFKLNSLVSVLFLLTTLLETGV